MKKIKKILIIMIIIIAIIVKVKVFNENNIQPLILSSNSKKELGLNAKQYVDIMPISSETIVFSDLNMYNKVYEELRDVITSHSDSEKSITVDVAQVTALSLNNANITNISGIEKFTALTELNISNNNITDISSIESLTNLTKLYAYGNTIKDINPISKLTKLTDLSLSQNSLIDSDTSSSNSATSVLSSLTNLQTLDMSHNYLKYTNGLESLTNLTKLDLYDNAIQDLSGLSTLKKLVELNLGENNESSVSHGFIGLEILNTLTDLKYLDFSENKTPEIVENITNLTNLEELSLQGNAITDTEVPYLEPHTNLIKLNLYDNTVKTLTSYLLNLPNLEELILGNNNLRTITPLYRNNSFVYKKLKKLDISGNYWLYTLYSNEIEDNNSSRTDNNEIIIRSLVSDVHVLNYEYITDTNNLPHYDNNGVAYVTYDDFGAKCDGVYDDFIAIRNAHIFANENGCEVRATEGKTYHIFKYYEEEVTVSTSVDWCNATMIIHDEEIDRVSGRFKGIFTVTNITDTLTLYSPGWTIGKNTKQLPAIAVNQLANLNSKGYETYLCAPINTNKKQYIRYGASANSGSNQQDYFLIDSEGNVLNDIQWDFEKMTSFVIYPIPNSEINLKNGNFISNALNSKSETAYARTGSEKLMYYYRDIYLNKAANVNISNLKHTLSEDVLSGSYRGFIYSNICANINISDTTLLTRKYSIAGRSTYDLVLGASVNVTCDNVTSNDINDTDRWGILGSNFCKDITFKGCTLNRIDAHQGVYNLTVDSCTVGANGLTMTGQGTLNIINTDIEATSFITLREDYGSTWDGNINIIDCKFIATGTSVPRLFTSTLAYDGYDLHDFGYKCKLPYINVYNLAIDMSGTTQNYIYINYINNIKTSSGYTDNTNKFLKEYLNKDILINQFEFENASSDAYIEVANIDIADYLDSDDYNYVFEKVEFKENNSNGKNLINDIDSDEKYSTNKTVYFRTIENNMAENTITIYKDNKKILEEQLVRDEIVYNFIRNGDYKIEIYSEDNIEGYDGTKTYEFTISGREIEKIEVTTLPTKTEYIQNNESLDLTGGKLTVTYNDESEEIVDLTDEDVKVTGFDNSKIGTNTLTVEYEGKTTTFDVEIILQEVEEKAVEKIEVTTLPTKIEYIQNNENLDLTGGKLTVTYNDESEEIVDLTDEDVKVTGFDNSKIGINTLTVEYRGKTVTFDIRVVAENNDKKTEDGSSKDNPSGDLWSTVLPKTGDNLLIIAIGVVILVIILNIVPIIINKRKKKRNA